MIDNIKIGAGKQVAEKEAPKLSDRLDAWSKKYGSAASKDMMGLDEANKKKNEKKAAAPDKVDEKADKPTDKSKKSDKLDPAKASGKPKISDVPQAKARKVVEGKPISTKSRVFDDEEAMIILKEHGKLDQNTPKDAKIPMTRAGLDNKIGTHADGKAREITLPSGRKIIVTKVEGIVFQSGLDTPDGHGPKQIDLGKGIAITVELAEEMEPPAPAPKPAPSAQPSSPPSGGKPAGPQPPTPGGATPGGGPPGQPAVPPPGSGPHPGQPAAPPPSGGSPAGGQPSAPPPQQPSPPAQQPPSSDRGAEIIDDEADSAVDDF
jgi:hypothetical protein